MFTCKPLSYALLALCLAASLTGCGQSADETKPVAEVKADADKMDAPALRDMAMTYKDAIQAKLAEVDKVQDKLKNIPLADMLGDEAKALKQDVENLNKSVNALKERFEIYYNKLKELKGDLSGLDA